MENGITPLLLYMFSALVDVLKDPGWIEETTPYFLVRKY